MLYEQEAFHCFSEKDHIEFIGLSQLLQQSKQYQKYQHQSSKFSSFVIPV